MLARRILWWCSGFDPPYGGAELWSQHVVRHFRGRGHDQKVIAITDGAETSRTSSFEAVPVSIIQPAEGLSNARSLSSTLRSIQESLAEHRPELILVNNFGHASLALLGLARSRIAAPILLVAHNPWPAEAAAPGSPLDLAARRAAMIMTFEPHIVEWVRERWPEVPLACVGHAMPADDRPIASVPGDLHLLFCGRLSPEKGPLILVEAIKELLQRHPSAQLSIAGSGCQRAEIEERIQALGLAAHVRMLGGVAPNQVSALIDQAYAVCIPSMTEGFGLVALEAAWRGRPVVASRVGGLPGLVGDGETGLLVPPGDPLALAEALGEILDDPARAERMGRAARVAAEARPSWSEHLEQMEAIIENVVQRHGSSDARAALG